MPHDKCRFSHHTLDGITTRQTKHNQAVAIRQPQARDLCDFVAARRTGNIEPPGVWYRPVYDISYMYGTIESQSLNKQQTKKRIVDMLILYTYISILLVAILVTVIMTQRVLNSRNTAIDKTSRLIKFYIKQVVNLLQEESHPPMYITAKSNTERIALCKAIYIVRSHTYGINSSLLDLTINKNRLEQLLLRRIRYSTGYKRAHWLMLMSCISLSHKSIKRIEQLCSSRNRAIRISSFISLITTNPQMAIRRIASLPYRLSPLYISHIISLLRRGIIPIAYEPLLQSDNYNLQMLGIAIVRNFGIDIADKQLHDIISSCNDNIVVREAILTLSSLGRPLGRTKIRQRMSLMNTEERKSFCRHLATEGYSVQALRTLFSEKEMHYAETLIKSYKRDLGCRQYT